MLTCSAGSSGRSKNKSIRSNPAVRCHSSQLCKASTATPYSKHATASLGPPAVALIAGTSRFGRASVCCSCPLLKVAIGSVMNVCPSESPATYCAAEGLHKLRSGQRGVGRMSACRSAVSAGSFHCMPIASARETALYSDQLSMPSADRSSSAPRPTSRPSTNIKLLIELVSCAAREGRQHSGRAQCSHRPCIERCQLDPTI